MPSIVHCDNKDCCFYDDYHECCDVDKLVIEHGVCMGTPHHGRNISRNDLDERLKAENAKLRELVREMLPPLLEGDCLWCVHHWSNRGDCTGDSECKLEERASKLGIGVKHGLDD